MTKEEIMVIRLLESVPEKCKADKHKLEIRKKSYVDDYYVFCETCEVITMTKLLYEDGLS